MYLKKFGIGITKPRTGYSSVWLERRVRDAEAVGSNPAIPTDCSSKRGVA